MSEDRPGTVPDGQAASAETGDPCLEYIDNSAWVLLWGLTGLTLCVLRPLGELVRFVAAVVWCLIRGK